MSYEKRLNEYREKTYWPEYTTHVSRQIKKLYPQIPADADPNEVVSRYKGAFAPDMTDEDFYSKLDETHAKGWKPSIEEPKPNLIETAQMVATPENAMEMGKGIVHFAGAQGVSKIAERNLKAVPAWMRAGWGAAPAVRSLGRVAGQGAMLVPTAIKLAGAEKFGRELEQTAQQMPAPNVQALQAKGYTPAQIQNVLKGYAETQRSLYEDVQKTGEEGVSAAAEGIANSAFLGLGGAQIEKAATRLMGGKALAGGAAAAAKAIASGTAAHTATGAVLGGGYGATHGATERMAKAKAAGLGANDILSAGAAGAWEEGAPSAVVGGLIGGAFGAPAATFTTLRAANASASAMRKALTEAHVEDAQRINLTKFADQFRPNELPERFPEDLRAAAGDDVALANNIVAGVWGPEVAATEHGQQAASKLYEKIISWRGTRNRLQGNMLELPQPAVQPVTPGAPGITPEQQAMGLQPTAQPMPNMGTVAPMPGMVQPTGPVMGQNLESQGVAPAWKPQMEQAPRSNEQQALAQAYAPKLPGLQAPAVEVPPPPTPPLALEGVQPAVEGARAPQFGPPLGPVEQGGRVIPPAPEINPRLAQEVPAPAPVVEQTPVKGTNPNDNVRGVVSAYNASAGMAPPRHGEYHPLNTDVSKRIARAYSDLPKTPQTPEAMEATKKSYEALNNEIAAQKAAIEAAGYKLEFTKEDPYKNSAEVLADVRQNKRLKVFESSESHHPFMTKQQTDDFRAVHDFFGHTAEGYQFGARGEDNAFRAHAQMFSNEAIPALATETRGQNSWVNFAPGHEELGVKDRPFAEQKVGLLPKWAYEEVLHPGKTAPEPHPVNLPSHAESAIGALGPHEHVTLATGPEGKHLTIEKLGVTAGTLSKPGASSDALGHVNAIADEHGLPVEAYVTPQAGPRGGNIPLAKLLPWYEQHGYKVTSQGEGWATVRRAPSEPAIAERVKDLPPEQAKMAAGNVTLGQPMVRADFGLRVAKFLDAHAEAARARIKARGTRLNVGIDPADLTDHAVILAADMFTHGMRTKTAVANWLVEKYGSEIKPFIEPLHAKAQKRLMQMFKSDARAQTKLKELVALRDSGAHGADWYEETADWVKKTFGPEDQDMFLRFLALTSADSSTEGGAALAMKAFAQWKGGLPFDGMRGPHMVGMLNDAVRGGDFGGDKIQSFYRALRGDKDAVVLDRWMIRALGFPASRSSLSDSDYKLYSQIVRNLAGDANMSPRQLQAAIWEGARVGQLHKRWKTGGAMAASKVGSARPLEHLLEREFGNMTPYQWVEYNKMKHDDLMNMSAGLRHAREHGGFTFDPQNWSQDKSPGYVVTLATDVVPKQKFYPAALTKFKNMFRRVLSTSAFGGPKLNIGVYSMGKNKPDHYSLDLNVVLPKTGPDALARAKALGKQTRQFEIGEVGEDGEYVQGHTTGYTKKQGPQFLPPKEGTAERAAWLKKAETRINTILDQVEFTLKPKER